LSTAFISYQGSHYGYQLFFASKCLIRRFSLPNNAKDIKPVNVNGAAWCRIVHCYCTSICYFIAVVVVFVLLISIRLNGSKPCDSLPHWQRL